MRTRTAGRPTPADIVLYAAAATPVLGMAVYALAVVGRGGGPTPVWAVWVVAGSAVVAASGLVLGVAGAVLSDRSETTAARDSRRSRPEVSVPAPGSGGGGSGAPWHRRSKHVSVMIVVGFLLFPPLLWAGCVICLTGDVYHARLARDGEPARWSAWNRWAAAAVLVLQAVLVGARLDALRGALG